MFENDVNVLEANDDFKKKVPWLVNEDLLLLSQSLAWILDS